MSTLMRRQCGGLHAGPALRYDAAPMIDRIREMPGGIRLFLAYAFLILAGIGLSLRFVIDQAIARPVSLRRAWS